MKKAIILLIVLLMASSVFAGTVIRSFDAGEVAVGEILSVTLGVTLAAGETYYAVEESIPAGWTVLSGGTPDSSNTLKWVWVEGATGDRQDPFVYTVQAPTQIGNHIFSGIYAFEGGIETAISGDSSMTVVVAAQCSQENYVGCTTELECTDMGGFWWTTDECNARSQIPQCTPENLADCTIEADCTGAGGYWWDDNTCNAQQQLQTPLDTLLEDIKMILQDTKTSTLSKISAIAAKLSAYFKAI